MSDENRGILDRLATRTRPSGALATIENTRTVVLLVAGALWGSAILAGVVAVVFFRSGEPVAGWLGVGLAVALIVTWVWNLVTGEVGVAALIALVAAVANQLGVHVTLGGYANSGGYLMWGIALTFAVALMVGRRPAIAVASFYVVVAVVFGFMEEGLAAGRDAPPVALTSTLFVLVLVGNLGLVSSVLVYFLVRLSFERARAEELLLNVLPEEVATELKESGRTAARRFEAVSVLFADIVGFTTLSEEMEPEEMLDHLNEIFTHFDALVEEYGCEKIRTIGDAYMVAAGVPTARDDHAHALAGMALDMLEYSQGGPLEFRLGINSGPVVAGVIGRTKFQYDVWGDTVNTASRMESHGVPGRIQISEATLRLVEPEFVCTRRGPVEVKGKGVLDTWFLEGRASSEVPDLHRRPHLSTRKRY